MSPDSNNFQLRFGVAEHDISVVTAVSSLLSVAEVLKEIGATSGDQKIDVSIRAPQPGSVVFDIFIAALPLASQALPIAQMTIDYAKVLIDILEISKTMNGERPKAISLEARDGSTVTNIVGNRGNVYIIQGDAVIAGNLMGSNTVIQKNVKTLGEAAKRDPDLSSLAFTYQDRDYLVDRPDFDSLEEVGEDTEDTQEISVGNAMLTIIRPSFYQNLKSDFYYNGNKIASLIQDGAFYLEIDQGKRFAKGDVLECILSIKQKYDSTVNTYINHSYVVKKVNQHHPRSEQATLGM